jgi:hypothetical protein
MRVELVLANIRLPKALILVLLLAALGLTACGGSAKVQKPDESAPTAQEPSTYEHTVRWPGETLSVIAKWYTGDTKNWVALARENPSVSPNKLKIGGAVQIPRELLTNTEPMPRSAIAQAASKSKRAHGSKGTVSRKGDPQVEPSGAAEAAVIQEAPESQPQKEKLDLFEPKE